MNPRRGACAGVVFALACGSQPPPAVGWWWFVVQVAAPPSDGGNGAACPNAPERIEAIADGDAGATVACRVRPDGDAFDVDLLMSTASASLTLTGTMSLAKSDVRATLSIGSTTLASSGPCTIDFTGVFSGRVGGDGAEAVALCPVVTDVHGHTCYVSAEFSFSNCAR